jgi:Protein of unknown function (DUF3375)
LIEAGDAQLRTLDVAKFDCALPGGGALLFHETDEVRSALTERSPMNQRPSTDPWDLDGTEQLINHPSIRLFRGSNAAMILTFLHRAFKEHDEIAIPESRLRARLENFIEDLRVYRPDVLPRAAAEYLAEWCNAEQLLLRRLYSESEDEAVFELTAASERALLWLEDLQARPFVAAESRLELIVRQLEEIVLFSTSDADSRIAALEAQQLALQSQIDTIRAARIAEAYSSVQLTERFANVLDLARGIAADFRQLEENFKEVARALAETQADPDTTKGTMVGHLLDTHAALRASPQGQSFYTFWRYLASPDRQEHWRTLTRQVYLIKTIDSTLRENRLLETLSNRLLIEGERVVRSNERMAATLRRALETAEAGESRRLLGLIREIQQLALVVRDAPPSTVEFFELVSDAKPFDTFGRRFWEREAPGFVAGRLQFANGTLTTDLAERFHNLAHISLAELRARVRSCLIGSETVLLSDVLRQHPPHEGILEVAGYLVIAMQDQHHYVAPDQRCRVAVGEPDGPEIWSVPEALFTRDSRLS